MATPLRLLAGGLTAAFIACGPEGGSSPLISLDDALPTSIVLHVDTPPAPAGVDHEPSTLLHATIDRATRVNEALSRITAPLGAILDAAATPIEQGDRGVWSAVLTGGVPALIVAERTGHGFSFLEAEDRGSGFVVRVAGTYTPGSVPMTGQGAAWASIGPDPAFGGFERVMALWSDSDDGLDLTVFLYGDRRLTAPPADEAYRFRRTPDGQREFAFRAVVDLEGLGTADSVAISRWREDGPGRTDVIGSGEDLDQAGYEFGEAVECWDARSPHASYKSVLAKEKNSKKKVPKVAKGHKKDCAYEEAADPVLPSVPPVPSMPPLPPEAASGPLASRR